MFVVFRAEFTKFIVQPVLGEPGVGGSMAVYGAFDALVSKDAYIPSLVQVLKSRVGV